MIITKKSLPRRTFLRGLGTTLALPLLDSMIPALSVARPPPKPAVRLGFVYHPVGMILDQLDSRHRRHRLRDHAHHEGARAVPREHGRLHRPGAGQGRALGDGAGDHAREGATWLTGVHPKKTEGVGIRAGISADQIAAREFGKNTQLASLELGLEESRRSPAAAIPAIAARTPTPSPGAAPPRRCPSKSIRAPCSNASSAMARAPIPAARLAAAQGAAQHSRLRLRQHRPPGNQARQERPRQAQRVSRFHPRYRAPHPEGRTAERRA